MSNLKLFLKGNKKQRESVKYAPTTSLLDEEGKPVEFEWKGISAKEDEALREDCTIDVQELENLICSDLNLILINT